MKIGLTPGKIHLAAFRPLFLEVLRLAGEMGMVKLGNLSTDGTKMGPSGDDLDQAGRREVARVAGLSTEIRQDEAGGLIVSAILSKDKRWHSRLCGVERHRHS